MDLASVCAGTKIKNKKKTPQNTILSYKSRWIIVIRHASKASLLEQRSVSNMYSLLIKVLKKKEKKKEKTEGEGAEEGNAQDIEIDYSMMIYKYDKSRWFNEMCNNI